MPNKAFLSYSHAADGKLASAIQGALTTFAKPWYGLRSMRVFRDTTSLSANAALWPSIVEALKASEWFLLLARDTAAQSPWVRKEISWWIANRPVDRFLILLTNGDIVWDEAGGDFDWARTTALPAEVLRGRFKGEPRWVDFRWAGDPSNLSLRHTQFRAAILDIAAPLLGRPKDELDSEEVRQHRRTKRIATAAGIGLVALTISSVAGGLIANQQRKSALSRELAAASNANLSLDPELSLLLAREAAHIAPTGEAEQALRRALIESRIRVILRGHTAEVTGAVFSPDGKSLVTIAKDATGRIWEASTGKCVRVLAAASDPFVNASFGSDGRTVTTTLADGSARTWDVASGSETAATLPASKQVDEEARIIRFDPSGRVTLSVYGEDNTRGQRHVAILRDAAHRKLAELQGHTGAILDAAFSRDGRYVLTASADSTARVWDAKTGQVVRVFNGHTDRVNTAEFSFDGRFVVTASRDNTARVWDARTGAVLAVLRGHGDWIGPQRGLLSRRGVNSAAFSPDARLVVTASGDGTARIWDAGTGLSAVAMKGRGEPIAAAVYDRDGSSVLTRSGPENVGKDPRERPPAAVPAVWDALTGGLRYELGAYGIRVTTAVFSPDGKWIATGGEDRKVRFWNPRNGVLIDQLPDQDAAVRNLAFSRDGARLAVSLGSDIRIYGVPDSTLVSVLQPGARALERLEFSPDGTLLLSSSGPDKLARIWDVKSGREVHTVRHSDAVARAIFSPTGSTFATASRDRTAALWDVRTGERRLTFQHADWVNRIAFSPKGDLLATASRDDSARIWSAIRGTIQLELGGHLAGLLSVEFSPDGKFIATGSGDNAARIWSVETGELLLQFNGATDRVMSAVFSQDGKRLLTASEDGVARIYECEICGGLKDLDSLAATRATRALSPDERRRYLHER